MNNAKELKDTVIEHNIKVHSKEAPVYDVIHPQLFNWYHTRKTLHDLAYILSFFEAGKEIQVLDLGCGTGFLTTKAIKWANVNITAVDLSKEMLSVLGNNLTIPQKQRVALVNDEAISFLHSNTDSYDIIMTSAFLHHLVDVKELIDMSVKNLKKNGIFYIAYEPLKQPVVNKIRFLLHRVIRQLDIVFFNIRMKMRGIYINEEHEKSMADYQTLMGGIDPNELLSCLKNSGTIVKFDRFTTRANGIFAFISDKMIKSQNTFSIVFRKTL